LGQTTGRPIDEGWKMGQKIICTFIYVHIQCVYVCIYTMCICTCNIYTMCTCIFICTQYMSSSKDANVQLGVERIACYLTKRLAYVIFCPNNLFSFSLLVNRFRSTTNVFWRCRHVHMHTLPHLHMHTLKILLLKKFQVKKLGSRTQLWHTVAIALDETAASGGVHHKTTA